MDSDRAGLCGMSSMFSFFNEVFPRNDATVLATPRTALAFVLLDVLSRLPIIVISKIPEFTFLNEASDLWDRYTKKYFIYWKKKKKNVTIMDMSANTYWR